MEVRVSGCVFSSLYIHLANSKGDIEGFLFGDISSRTRKTVSDSQDVSVKHERIFAVQDLLVCRGLFSFYDGVGSIHPEKLTGILGNKKENVLGWFKFRRNSRLCVSMREKAVHRNLLEQLEIKQSHDFFSSVFTSSFEPNMSTHLYKYSACYCAKDSRVFHGVPIAIVNLGHTSQSEYKQHIEPTRSTSKQYQNIIGSFRDEFLDNVGQLQQVKHARSMYSNMLGKLKFLAETVKSSESELLAISQQVHSLKEELKNEIEKKRNKGQSDLIELNNEEQEPVNLMTFEEPPQQEHSAEKVVVVAKHINDTKQMNNTNYLVDIDSQMEDHFSRTNNGPTEHMDEDAYSATSSQGLSQSSPIY